MGLNVSGSPQRPRPFDFSALYSLSPEQMTNVIQSVVEIISQEDPYFDVDEYGKYIISGGGPANGTGA